MGHSIKYLPFIMKFRKEITKCDKAMLDIMKEEIKKEYDRRRKKGE